MLRNHRHLIALLALLSLLVVPAGCDRTDSIVVGAKAFTEGYLLGHMAVMVLQEAGYPVEEQFGLATTAMRSALETGQVDLYYEYTGTAYTVYAHGTDTAVMTDSARVFNAVNMFDREHHALCWLAPLPFNDTYALLMAGERSRELGIRSIGDLARAIRSGRSLRVGVDAEFFERPDGLKALLKRYDVPESGVVKLDAGLIYPALVNGKIDVGMGYSTDGQIVAMKLEQLEDDLHFFPAYNPAAVVRCALLEHRPEIRTVLEKLNRFVTPEVIRALNAEVSMQHHDPRKVAERWLRSTALIH